MDMHMKSDDVNSDSLLPPSSKLNYHPFITESMTTSLTDVSSLSFFQMNNRSSRKPLNKSTTCSCSTCTCSSNYQKTKLKNLSLENNDDCLTHTFIILYESSIWCMQSIYEIFFKALWQVLMYAKQELQYRQGDNKTIRHADMMQINNSAEENYPLICTEKTYSDLPQYHFSLLQSTRNNRRRHHRLRKSNGKNKTTLSDKACDSMSNHILSEEKNSSNDRHSAVVSVPLSQCQTVKNDLQTICVDLDQTKNINLHEPLIFMNREMYRSSVVSTVPFHHSAQYIPRQHLNQGRDIFSYKQPSFIQNRNEITSTSYTVNQTNKPSTINLDLFPIPSTPTSHEILSNLMDVQEDKTLVSNNSQPFVSNLHKRRRPHKKSKQIIDDSSIPLTLATSLHSNVSLYNNDDYYLSKYIHQLLIDKHHLR